MHAVTSIYSTFLFHIQGHVFQLAHSSGHSYRSYLKFEASLLLVDSGYSGMVRKKKQIRHNSFFSAWRQPNKIHSLPAEIWTLDLRSKRARIQFYIGDNKSFFLRRYATYCCLILGPAAVGHYLGLQPYASESAWNSKESDVLSQIW